MFRFVVHSDREKHSLAWKTTEKYKPATSRAMLQNTSSQPALPCQPSGSVQGRPIEPEQEWPSKKRNTDPKDGLANVRMKALQQIEAEQVTPIKSGPPDTVETPTKKANSESPAWVIRSAEQGIKVVYTRICALTMRSSEIQHNVSNLEDWKWLSVSPQYSAFLKDAKKFEESKQESPLLRRLLLAGGDLGHYVKACGPPNSLALLRRLRRQALRLKLHGSGNQTATGQ